MTKLKGGIVQYGFLNLKDGERGGGWKEFYRKHYLGISINMIRLYSVYYRLSRCTFLPVWLTFNTPQWLSSCHSLMKNQVVKYGTVVICYTCVTGKFWPLWKQTVQTSKRYSHFKMLLSFIGKLLFWFMIEETAMNYWNIFLYFYRIGFIFIIHRRNSFN